MTFFPHAPLGVVGVLSSDPSKSTVDWVAVLMLGLFLGILLVSGGFYLMTRKQILAIKRETVSYTHLTLPTNREV